MPSRSLVSPQDNWERVFSGAGGLWLALALIKFGNPVILERQIEVPTTRDEFVLHPWPMAWGYALFACFVVLGLRFWRWRTDLPRWLLVLPLAWLGWQALSALQTIEPALTGSTLKHFVVCVLAFYLGLFAFSRVTALRPFWIGLLGGF